MTVQPTLPPDTFFLNPANQRRSTPKRARVSRWTRLNIFLTLALIGVWGVAVFQSARENWRWDRLTNQGEIISGMVESKRLDDTGLYISYWFSTGGQAYSQEERVPLSIYDRLEPQAPLDILYLPNNPKQARIANNWIDEPPYSALLIAIACALPILLMGGLSFLGERMSSGGEIVIGEVLSAKAEDLYEGYTMEVRYSFVSPRSGETIKATDSRRAESLRSIKPPKAGRTVAVLYLNDRVHRLF